MVTAISVGCCIKHKGLVAAIFAWLMYLNVMRALPTTTMPECWVIWFFGMWACVLQMGAARKVGCFSSCICMYKPNPGGRNMGICAFCIGLIGFIAAQVMQTQELQLSSYTTGYMFLALMTSLISVILCQVTEDKDETVVANDVEANCNQAEESKDFEETGVELDAAGAVEANDIEAEENKDFEETGVVAVEETGV
jgi:nitrate/nitrite transporter NarK